MSDQPPADLRPSDLAMFLLASGETLPRKRARDQQADIAGLELKRRVLDLVIAHDPDPAQVELCLARIVDEIGPPTGPTRAICGSLRDEWEMAAANPGLIEWLIEQALAEGQRGPERRDKRRGRSDR